MLDEGDKRAGLDLKSTSDKKGKNKDTSLNLLPGRRFRARVTADAEQAPLVHLSTRR